MTMGSFSLPLTHEMSLELPTRVSLSLDKIENCQCMQID